MDLVTVIGEVAAALSALLGKIKSGQVTHDQAMTELSVAEGKLHAVVMDLARVLSEDDTRADEILMGKVP